MGFYAVPFLPVARASHGGDEWAPLGPYANTVQIMITGSGPCLIPEYWECLGDLPNWTLQPELVSSICNGSLYHCELFSGLEMWGLDFNGHPEARYWGVIKGSDEEAVTEVKRAIAHLTDKEEHISETIQGLATRLDAVLPGYQYLWAEPFDSIHQGPRTLRKLRFDDSASNSIFVSVSNSSSDVFLVHVSGDETNEGVLGDYAGLCRDGGKCISVSAAEKHPGSDGTLGTRDDEFNFDYLLYNDVAKDGFIRFDSVTDSKTGAKIPLPPGTYIVYAVNNAAGKHGWGHMSYPDFNMVFVDIANPLPAGGWYNNARYPDSGYEEFCEARDHLVRIRTDINDDDVEDTPFKDADGDCRIDKDSAIFSAPGYRKMIFYIRMGFFRLELGDRLTSRIETLFGGNDVVDEQRVNRSAVVRVVFTGKPFDDWELYTMGWTVTREFGYIDHMYNKQFGWPPCGIGDDQILEGSNNYPSFCNQLFSTAARAVRNTLDPNAAKLATFLHNFALGSYPVWATGGFKAYHNAWTGVVNQVAEGTSNVQSIINMHPVEDCSRHGKLVFQDLDGDGCWDFGESLTLRWAFENSTRKLNPFQSNWAWDWRVFGLVHDTLQSTSPYGLQDDYGSVARTWTNFPWPTAAQLGYTPRPYTDLTQRWFIKNHLGWSDGTPVTGKDVVLSILGQREASSCLHFCPLESATYVRLISDVPSQIVVDVGMYSAASQLQAGHLVGTLPIVPCSVYSTGLDYDGPDADTDPDQYTLPNCAGIQIGQTYPVYSRTTVTGVDRRYDFDVTFVPDEDGDGVPESDCDDLGSHRTGHRGSGPYIIECTSNGTAEPGIGGNIVLRKFTTSKPNFARAREYWASPHNYLQWRWADFNNNGVVDTGDKARTRTNPPTGCRQKPVPTNQALWDANRDGVPDDICVQFDFNRNGISSDISERLRMSLESGKRWTPPFSWPWPRPTANGRAVAYPWIGWVWWLSHQCLGPDKVKETADDDRNACWFTKFASRPP